MSRSDYLMRIVRQFSKMLAALLTRSRTLDREPTPEELDELSRGFAGFDISEHRYAVELLRAPAPAGN